MARPQTPPIAAQMRHARSYAEQIAALRQLKNEVVGHVVNKERWVEYGIIETIVRLLRDARSTTNISPNGKGSRKSSETPVQGLSEQEQVRFQALQLLSIFARGGPGFLKPLHETDAFTAIVENLYPLDNPGEVVEAAVHALCSASESVKTSREAATDSCALADVVFSPFGLGAFHSILESKRTTRSAIEQRNGVNTLIGSLCKEDQHQNLLANYGILDDLATRLAAHAVARGEVVPGAAEQDKPHGLDELIPDPAPPTDELHALLGAVATIIGDSKFRASLFLNSPVLLAVFPFMDFHPSMKTPVAAREAMEMAGLAAIRWRLGAMDYLLPAVPAVQHQKPSSSSTPFPTLGFSTSRSRQTSTPSANGNSRSTSRFSFLETHRPIKSPSHAEPELDDAESPLIPWLIHLFRTTDGLDRLMAASVLACVMKAGVGKAEREAQMAQMVVPTLCALMKEAVNRAREFDSVTPEYIKCFNLLDMVPSILARLVSGSEALQKAAYDNGLIKTAGKLLSKVSYTTRANGLDIEPAWSPSLSDRDYFRHLSWEEDYDGPARRLGDPGLGLDRAYRVRFREGALKVIGAMIALKEEYRKVFADTDAVGWLVYSLYECPAPFGEKPEKSKEPPEPIPEYKPRNREDAKCDTSYTTNSKAVIIAACHVVRLLARSVSVLRTSLWDYGVGRPLFILLKEPDPETQLAACSAACNMILAYSPSREYLVQCNIVKVLCEFAHSHDAGLRHEAMWCLKHLVTDAAPEMKKQCIDELEPGWLIQLICSDTEDDALFAKLSRDRPSHPENDNDEFMDASETPQEAHSQHHHHHPSEKPWQWPGLHHLPSNTPGAQLRTKSTLLQQAETKLLALRETESDPVRKARSDDLAVQEQALAFIRNLLLCSTEKPDDQTEMVDYLFTVLGQDRLFEILTSKLNTRVLHPFSRSSPSGRESRVVYPQPRVVEHVVFILVHIAASIPRHRQLVVAHTELLRQVGQHLNSKNAHVRVAVCQLLSNLVWKDDEGDTEACQQRKAELKRLGFESKLQTLLGEDAELNVREKARVAAWEMKQ